MTGPLASTLADDWSYGLGAEVARVWGLAFIALLIWLGIAGSATINEPTEANVEE